MKKKFIEPKIEISIFETKDVMIGSGEEALPLTHPNTVSQSFGGWGANGVGGGYQQ